MDIFGYIRESRTTTLDLTLNTDIDRQSPRQFQ